MWEVYQIILFVNRTLISLQNVVFNMKCINFNTLAFWCFVKFLNLDIKSTYAWRELIYKKSPKINVGQE